MTEKILKQIHGGEQGAFAKYRELHVGRAGFAYLVRYELCMLLLKNLPGMLGLFLRKVFYRGLFKRAGKGVLIGAGVALRCPLSIDLGDHVVLDDGCVLDAKGTDNAGITVGSDVFVSRNAIIACKGGSIALGSRVSIGPNCVLQSVGPAALRIGDGVMVASNCHLIACGDYRIERTDVPMMEQGVEPGLGIEIERDVWLGSSVVVLDGARIREGAVIGAMSLVRGEIPPRTVAVGRPAVVRRERGK